MVLKNYYHLINDSWSEYIESRLGERVVKLSLWAFVFKYFQEFKEKQGPSTSVTFAPRLYSDTSNLCYHTHAPGQHMVLPPGPTPSAPKQWKSDVQRVRTRSLLSAWECHSRKPITKKRVQQYRSSAIWKHACQCTDGVSATQKAAENFSTLQEQIPYCQTYYTLP